MDENIFSVLHKLLEDCESFDDSCKSIFEARLVDFSDYQVFKLAEVAVRRNIVNFDYFSDKLSAGKYLVLKDWGLYVKANPLNAAEYSTARISANERYLADGGKSLARLLIAAIDKKIPFSAVRIGDGEGRFLNSYVKYPGFEKYFEEVANSVWFWNSQDKPRIYSDFYQTMRQSFLNSDVLGCSPLSRVRMEWLRGCLGYVGVHASNVFCTDNFDKISYLAPNWFNAELEAVKFFEEIAEREIFI